MTQAHTTTATNGLAGNTMPGEQLFCYFSSRKQGLISVRSVGETWLKTLDLDWHLLGIKRADLSLDQWLAGKAKQKIGLAPWRLGVKDLPTMGELEEWVFDGVCETVSGDTVEPDAYGADGAPSWLIAFGWI